MNAHLRRRLCTIVLQSAERCAQLAALRDAGPKEAWLSAGFVRNAVFEALFGPQLLEVGSDLDVIYFDPLDVSEQRDRTFERALRSVFPAPWQVKNQVRMAARNGHPGYRDLEHAVAHFPETATAVAVRLRDATLQVLAPHGLDDLFDGVICRSPPADPLPFSERTIDKRWQERWPELRIVSRE